MLNKLWKLRRKKGFTLVEMIIVVAILAVLLVCVAAFSGPVQRMVRATAASADALNINEIIGDYIEGRLSFAKSVKTVYAVDASMVSSALNDKVGGSGGVAAMIGLPRSQGGGGKAGVLVFRYIADGEESSYQIYDIPIASGTLNYTPPASETDWNKYKVFSDAFYGDSQRLILMPTEMQKGKVRSEIYMTVDIYSYKASADYLNYNADGSLNDTNSVYIQADTLGNIYDQKKAATPSTAELDSLAQIRTGPVESITFRMNNLKTVAAAEKASEIAAPAGRDILVFYYIPNYDIDAP